MLVRQSLCVQMCQCIGPTALFVIENASEAPNPSHLRGEHCPLAPLVSPCGRNRCLSL